MGATLYEQLGPHIWHETAATFPPKQNHPTHLNVLIIPPCLSMSMSILMDILYDNPHKMFHNKNTNVTILFTLINK